MRTLRLLVPFLASLITFTARADDQRFDLTEFNLGAARAVQGGGAAIGPLLVYLPHYGFWLGDRAASLGVEVGVTSFRDRGRSDFVATQYGVYQAFQPIRNLEVRLAAGMQRWENSRETSPYFLAEARLLLTHPDRHFLKGLYAFYSYVAHDRRTEVSGGGLVLHWPSPITESTPVAPPAPEPVVAAAPVNNEVASENLPELVIMAAPSSKPSTQIEVVALSVPPVAVEPLAPEPAHDSHTTAANGPAVDDDTVALVNGTQSGSFNVNSLFFGKVYQTKLKAVADALVKTPQAKVVITGYADATENEPTQLADRRAQAVKAFLVAAGVGASRLDAAGNQGPAPETSAAFADGGTRRVDLWVDQ